VGYVLLFFVSSLFILTTLLPWRPITSQHTGSIFTTLSGFLAYGQDDQAAKSQILSANTKHKTYNFYIYDRPMAGINVIAETFMLKICRHNFAFCRYISAAFTTNSN